MALGTADYLLKSAEVHWHPLGEKIDFKLFRYNPDTGQYVVLLRMGAGSAFQDHQHYGAAEFLVLKGEFEFDGRVAEAGDYGWEAYDARHRGTAVKVDTEMLLIGHGPVLFDPAPGEAPVVLDGGLLRSIASAQ
jgi:anti-sigma factor ChrR (cupin superfamily)